MTLNLISVVQAWPLPDIAILQKYLSDFVGGRKLPVRFNGGSFQLAESKSYWRLRP